MPAVALTDHGSLAGAVELYREARKAGVKPVVGCEVYVADDRKAQRKGYAHLTLLAESNEGYANLIKLSSLGYLEGYYYKPRVDWELLRGHAKGIVALSGCLSGRVNGRSSGSGREAPADLDRLVQIFGRDRRTSSSRIAGLEAAGADQPRARSPSPARRACRWSCTGDVHYLAAADAVPHEALLCIQTGDTLENPNRLRSDTIGFYLQSRRGDDELAARFGEDAAMRQHARDRRALQRRDRPRSDPPPDVPERPDGQRRLRVPRRAVRGRAAPQRYGKETPELRERLQFELKTIREMGFADYFLIVSGLHRLRHAERRRRGPGPRLGGRLARRLLPRHHRHRPDHATGCCSSAS